MVNLKAAKLVVTETGATDIILTDFKISMVNYHDLEYKSPEQIRYGRQQHSDLVW